MEEINGGGFGDPLGINAWCNIYGWAVAASSGAAPGSVEMYILADLSYDYCIESIGS